MRSLITLAESMLEPQDDDEPDRSRDAELEGRLAALEQKAAGMGVELIVRHDSSDVDGRIILGWIARKKKMDGSKPAKQGSGDIIMQELVDIADEFDRPIELAAEKARPGLISYYERYGFEETDGGASYRADGDDASMTRFANSDD